MNVTRRRKQKARRKAQRWAKRVRYVLTVHIKPGVWYLTRSNP